MRGTTSSHVLLATLECMSCSIFREATDWNGGNEPVRDMHLQLLDTAEPDASKC